MNRMIRVLLCALCILLLCGNALAASVRYEGGAEKFVFLPGNSSSNGDLFDGFKGMLPGDVRTQKITVKNNTGDRVRIYMRAEAVSAQDADFLSRLKMKVEAGSKTIFEAAAGEKAQLTGNTLLGTFKKNGSTELTVTLSVPIELGNEYMDCEGTVPWVFLAEEVKTGTSADTADWFDMGAWLCAAAMLSALILVLILRSKRKTT